MSFVDPRSVPFVRPPCRGDLPHLYKPGCTYFVTFRLFDAVVFGRTADLSEYGIDVSDDPATLLATYEPPVDMGSCMLRDPDVADVVAAALGHFDGERYELIAWCVMPNHVHAVVTPFAGHALGDVLHSWKSFTAHAINRRLGRRGAVWEKESFDHLVRTPSSLDRFVAYTEANPLAAGLCATQGDWRFSSAYHAVRARGTRAPQGVEPSAPPEARAPH
jgi:REP element-mobilizing transposase RayT